MKTRHSHTPTLPARHANPGVAGGHHSILLVKANCVLKWILILVSVYYVATYSWVAFHRIGYPFELEWQEGAIVDHCRRLIGGQPLYAAPDLSFTPFFYPPVYFYLSGLLMKVIGVDFFAPRLISLLSSLGVILLIFQIVRRETGSVPGALLAAGFFAAAYRATGAWLDLARVDSLFIFWLALGVFWSRRSERRSDAVITAVIFSIAFHTKQFALLPALAAGLYYLCCARRRFIAYGLSLAIGIGGGILLLNYHYRGWYIYYVFALPLSHKLLKSQLLNFWREDMLFTFPVALAVTLYFWIVGIQDWYQRGKNSRGAFYLFLGSGLFLAGWLGRGNVNSYANTLIPVVFAFSLILGMEAARCWRKINLSPAALFILNGILLAQFILLLYLPGSQIPALSDRRAGSSFIRFISEIPGKVFIPYHGFLPYLAGKETSVHWVGILDVLIAGGRSENGPARILLEQIEESLKNQKFEAVILDREDWFPDWLKEGYRKTGLLFDDAEVFYPVTGYRTRPQSIYRKICPDKMSND